VFLLRLSTIKKWPYFIKWKDFMLYNGAFKPIITKK